MLLDESTAPSAAAATAAAVDSSRGGDTGGGSVGTCAPQPASACIAIDDLSALIGYCGEHAALGLLEALRRHPSVSCLLAGLHAVRGVMLGLRACAHEERLGERVEQCER